MGEGERNPLALLRQKGFKNVCPREEVSLGIYFHFSKSESIVFEGGSSLYVGHPAFR
jgi:hypothetical protein